LIELIEGKRNLIVQVEEYLSADVHVNDDDEKKLIDALSFAIEQQIKDKGLINTPENDNSPSKTYW
jgi:hypothetical protein